METVIEDWCVASQMQTLCYFFPETVPETIDKSNTHFPYHIIFT